MGKPKKWFNWCDFGNHWIEPGPDGKRRPQHVFPIPICEAFPEAGWAEDGATACQEHYPAILKLQIEQGLLMVE